jgi:hypothetical protein
MDECKDIDNRYDKANMYDNTSGMYKWNIDVNVNSE